MRFIAKTFVMEERVRRVIVVGGGAAGLIAAYAAATKGNKVTLYEKNEKLGKKLYITGKGRCNLTNASDVETTLNQVVSNRKFLYSSFYSFDAQMVMDLIERAGCPLKVERGNRVFPVSDKSSDIIKAWERLLREQGVNIQYRKEVTKLLIQDQVCKGVVLKDGEKIAADAVIVTTGGLSYPSTGSTGDGYRFAKDCGHEIIKQRPALVPLVVGEEWVSRLQGLSLRNIEVRIQDGKKVLFREFGEMLFTHFGVSGPVLLSGSSLVTRILAQKELELFIDLKPALSAEQLDVRLLREFEEVKNRQFKNAVSSLFPSSLVPVFVEQTKILPEKPVNQISKEERQIVIEKIKNFKLTLVGVRGYNEAIITQGGICVKQIDPGTMESRLVSHLHFAGEVLDLDAFTGGYNLQIAWSTGYAAGAAQE